MSLSSSAAARLWYPVALATLAAVWLVMLVFGTGPLDQHVYELLYAGRWPLLVKAAGLLTAIGQPTVLIASSFIVAGFLSFRGELRLALALMLVIMIGRSLTELQKDWVGRLRPTLEPHLVGAKTFAFPSG